MTRCLRGAVVSSLVFVACGGDGADAGRDTSGADSQATDASDAIETGGADETIADAAADAPVDAAGEIEEVGPEVVGASLSFQFAAGPRMQPVGDLIVWWTPPGGTRREVTSDSSGRVTFDDIDWSRGTAEILGVKPGYAVVYARVDQAFIASNAYPRTAAGDPILVIDPLEEDATPTIEVTGRAQGMSDPQAVLVVSGDTTGIWHMEYGANFALTPPPSTAFNWVAHTWVGTREGRTATAQIPEWAVGHSPGGAEDYVMPIDFVADGVVPTRRSLSFELPQSARSTIGTLGVPAFVVWAKRDFVGFIGGSENVRISEDGARVEVDASWVVPDWADQVTTGVSLQGGGEISAAFVLGLPDEALPRLRLMVPPTWVGGTGARAIDEVLTWVTEEAEAPVVITVTIGSGDNARVGGRFIYAPGTTTATLPAELPGGLDLFGYLDSTSLSVRVGVCEVDPAISQGLCTRYGISKMVPLTR